MEGYHWMDKFIHSPKGQFSSPAPYVTEKKIMFTVQEIAVQTWSPIHSDISSDEQKKTFQALSWP